MPPKTPKCPVIPFTDQVILSATALTISLKNLRQAMRHCVDCEAGLQCPTLYEFNQKFNTALNQITDEWQLT